MFNLTFTLISVASNFENTWSYFLFLSTYLDLNYNVYNQVDLVAFLKPKFGT